MILLTERQREVLNFVFLGKTNGEIGAILDLSPLTIKNHVDSILKRLCVPNRMAAVYVALSKGIIAPPKEDPGTPPPTVADDWIEVRSLRVSWARQEARYGNTTIRLDHGEFSILYAFLSNPGIVLSRERLMTQACLDQCADFRVVDTRIKSLRKLLAPFGFEKSFVPVYGQGYKFMALSA